MEYKYPAKVLISGGKPSGGVASFAESLRHGFSDLGLRRKWRRTPAFFSQPGSCATRGTEDPEPGGGVRRAGCAPRALRGARLSLRRVPWLAQSAGHFCPRTAWQMPAEARNWWLSPITLRCSSGPSLACALTRPFAIPCFRPFLSRFRRPAQTATRLPMWAACTVQRMLTGCCPRCGICWTRRRDCTPGLPATGRCARASRSWPMETTHRVSWNALPGPGARTVAADARLSVRQPHRAVWNCLP